MHAIAVHGGAGDIPPHWLTPEREAAYHAGLQGALRAGQAILQRGGSSLDAVVAAVQVLEDDPLFNAGRGSVIAANGKCELDASLMEGKDLRAGAVTGLRHVRSPIQLARLVMDKSPHVMLSGPGAEEFALEHGLEPVPNSYFVTERRQRELDAELHGIAAGNEPVVKGTVGAVALDEDGNLSMSINMTSMTRKNPMTPKYLPKTMLVIETGEESSKGNVWLRLSSLIIRMVISGTTNSNTIPIHSNKFLTTISVKPGASG